MASGACCARCGGTVDRRRLPRSLPVSAQPAARVVVDRCAQQCHRNAQSRRLAGTGVQAKRRAPSWRVRSGGDPQDPSRRARRPLARIGYRHRPLHGPTRGRQAASASKGKAKASTRKSAKCATRRVSANASPSPSARLGCRHRSPEARATKHGFAGGSFAPCGARGGAACSLGAFGGGTQGRADEGFRVPLCCSKKGISDPSPRQVAQGIATT